MPSRTRYYFMMGDKPCFTRKQILAAVQNYLGKTARDTLQALSGMRFVDALREIAVAYLGKSGFILFVVREPRSARGGNSTYVKITSDMYGIPWRKAEEFAQPTTISFNELTAWQSTTPIVFEPQQSSDIYTQTAGLQVAQPAPTPPQPQPGQLLSEFGGHSLNSFTTWNSSNS